MKTVVNLKLLRKVVPIRTIPAAVIIENASMMEQKWWKKVLNALAKKLVKMTSLEYQEVGTEIVSVQFEHKKIEDLLLNIIAEHHKYHREPPKVLIIGRDWWFKLQKELTLFNDTYIKTEIGIRFIYPKAGTVMGITIVLHPYINGLFTLPYDIKD